MPEDGYEFEEEFAAEIGGSLVPHSGQGKWAKMDANGAQILWSCKWTSHETRKFSVEEFDEVMRAVRGPGGVGGDTLPGMAIGLQDRSFVVMETADFAELVLNREPTVVVMSAGESRRHLANETPLQRAMRKES